MISDRAFAGADTLATSYALTKALEKSPNIVRLTSSFVEK